MAVDARGHCAITNIEHRSLAVEVMDNGSTLTREGSPECSDADDAEDDDRDLTCEVSYETGRVIATVAGELDIESAPGLERHLRALLMLPLDALTIDLTRLVFMDSTGLAALVRVHQMASELRMNLSIEHPDDRVAWMLDLTRLGAAVVSDTTS